MKVATFNANSIRARLPIVLDWLAENRPDVLALQETKVDDSQFPVREFQDVGWHVAMHGTRGRNGVALIASSPILGVSVGFEDGAWPDDGRLIAGRVGGLWVLNTYVPNGTAVGSEQFDYKLRWLRRFARYVADRFKVTDPVVWMGDINIAPTEEDLYNPKKYRGSVGFHPDEIAVLDEVKSWGWVDVFRRLNFGGGHYTYWDYVIPRSVERNLGWRIDHIYAPPHVAEKCKACYIDREPRTRERPSDHTFVVAEFD